MIYTEKLHRAELAYLMFIKNSVMDVKLAKHFVTIQIGVYTFLQWWKQKNGVFGFSAIPSMEHTALKECHLLGDPGHATLLT